MSFLQPVLWIEPKISDMSWYFLNPLNFSYKDNFLCKKIVGGPANAGEPPTAHLFLHNLRFGMSVFEQKLYRGEAEQDKNKKTAKTKKIENFEKKNFNYQSGYF